MVQRGFEHLTARMQLLATETKILNAWIRLMPGLLAQEGATIPGQAFTDTVQLYSDALDKLATRSIENAELLLEMDKAIKFYSKI